MSDAKKQKRAAAEAWDALEQMGVDDEVDRVLSLSDEELDAELAKGGVDPEQVRARGAELAARVAVTDKSGVPEGDKNENKKKNTTTTVRARWVAWLAPAAVAGVAAILILAKTNPGPVANPAPPPESPAEHAARLRADGLAACDRREWAHCLELLDQARELDPEGDRAARVQDARRAAPKTLPPR